MSRAGGEKASRPSVGEATLGVYQGVIDDVVANVKADFVQEGVDESILDELRSLWESYLVKLGVLGKANDAAEKPAKTPPDVPDLSKLSENASVLAARPTQEAEPVEGTLGGSDRKRAAEGALPSFKHIKTEAGSRPGIPQWDGAVDEGAGPSSDPSASAVAGVEAESRGDTFGDEDLDDELNEDDDLEDVDNVGSDSEEKIVDVMLGQFDKVHRSKARWKVNLRHCILQLDGRDYLLHKATGEFNF